MIRINKQFAIERYAHGWELYETRKHTLKDADTTSITYYATIDGAIKSILRKSAGNGKDLKDVLNCIRESEKDIVTAINTAGIDELCRLKKVKTSIDNEYEEDDEDIDEDEEYDNDEDIIVPARRKIA